MLFFFKNATHPPGILEMLITMLLSDYQKYFLNYDFYVRQHLGTTKYILPVKPPCDLYLIFILTKKKFSVLPAPPIYTKYFLNKLIVFSFHISRFHNIMFNLTTTTRWRYDCTQTLIHPNQHTIFTHAPTNMSSDMLLAQYNGYEHGPPRRASCVIWGA